MESGEVMDEMKGLLGRSRWREVGMIHPSSDTRWIMFELGERKEERREECSAGN